MEKESNSSWSEASLHLSNTVASASWNGPVGLLMEPHPYCLFMLWLLMEEAGELYGSKLPQSAKNCQTEKRELHSEDGNKMQYS